MLSLEFALNLRRCFFGLTLSPIWKDKAKGFVIALLSNCTLMRLSGGWSCSVLVLGPRVIYDLTWNLWKGPLNGCSAGGGAGCITFTYCDFKKTSLCLKCIFSPRTSFSLCLGVSYWLREETFAKCVSLKLRNKKKSGHLKTNTTSIVKIHRWHILAF